MESLTPSPSPSPCPCPEQENNLVIIECGVLITIILVFTLFVLGCLRRRIHDTWQGACIMLLYTTITLGIPYLIGLMRSLYQNQHHGLKLFPVWAYFLLFAYAGPDTMTAANFSDIERSVGYYFGSVSLMFGADVLIGVSVKQLKLKMIDLVLLVLLYLLTLWNTMDTIAAFLCASKSHALPRITASTEVYMRYTFNNRDVSPGYAYIVEEVNPPRKSITTVDVWQCVGTGSVLGDDTKGRLKDMCLSYAFFNTLLMRFAGYPLPHASRPKSLSFVRENLLMRDGTRLFRIIEVELEFLFDFFYTKYYYLNRVRFAFKFKRLGGIVICVLFAVFGLRGEEEEHSIFGVRFLGRTLEIQLTKAVIILIAMLEAVQVCMHVFSSWTIVRLLCLYVRDQQARRRRVVIEKAMVFISNVKLYFSTNDEGMLNLKPWKRKLGQYTLVESYDHVPILRRLFPCYAWLLNYPRVGQKECPAIPLSPELKRAVVSYLKDYGFALSRGTNSLARNGLSGRFTRVCGLTRDASFILVWHTSTSFCEHLSLSSEDDHYFRVATQLSKYCAYLVVFAPKLLCGVPFEALSTFDVFIVGAREIFKETTDMGQRWMKMEELCMDTIEYSIDDGRKLIKMAAMVTNGLKSYVLNEPSRGWRVLAEFWVEVLLYLTPCDNQNVTSAHAECLAKGGEFITHLWALFTHAGITSRADFQTVT